MIVRLVFRNRNKMKGADFRNSLSEIKIVVFPGKVPIMVHN